MRRRWVRTGPCAEWALRGLHPLLPDLVRWWEGGEEGGFALPISLFYSPPPPYSLSLSLRLCLSLSLVMLIAPKVRASAALHRMPTPSPGFEWHVLIRPNLIGRRCLGWIGTALYSPLLLMCVDVCMCVRVRVMHVRL